MKEEGTGLWESIKESPNGDDFLQGLDEWVEAHREEMAVFDEKIRQERKKHPLEIVL